MQLEGNLGLARAAMRSPSTNKLQPAQLGMPGRAQAAEKDTTNAPVRRITYRLSKNPPRINQSFISLPDLTMSLTEPGL